MWSNSDDISLSDTQIQAIAELPGRCEPDLITGYALQSQEG